MPNVKKIWGLNIPGTPWATSACCGRPLTFTHCHSKRACYAIRYVKHFMSQDTLRTIYFSYFHSNLSYGTIFWGNSAHSSNIFEIQKRIIRIIMNATNRDSCHQLFKNLKILPLKSQYIFSLLLFVAKKIEIYVNQIRKFKISTPDLVLTYILQL